MQRSKSIGCSSEVPALSLHVETRLISKSKHLRLSDIQAVYRLVAECRELGDDAREWRFRLVQGALQLVGARVGLSGELAPPPAKQIRPLVEIGWASGQSDVCFDYWIEQINDDIFWQRVVRGGGFLKTIIRPDYVADAEWYSQNHVHEVLRVADIDGMIVSGRLTDAQAKPVDRLSLFRDWGDSPFTERERLLMQFLHDEIYPLVGKQLAAADEAAPSGLSPRKREVLECLLDGDTDQQIASRLKLAKPTVSEYVTAVYRHFGVTSRPQLLARFLRRFRRP